MRERYTINRVALSAPQSEWDRTFSRSSALRHLILSCWICGLKVRRRSNTRPRNLVCSTTGIGNPPNVSWGSSWQRVDLQKWWLWCFLEESLHMKLRFKRYTDNSNFCNLRWIHMQVMWMAHHYKYWHLVYKLITSSNEFVHQMTVFIMVCHTWPADVTK